MTLRIIGPDRRDVRPIPVTRENALIEVGQHDILRRPFIDREQMTHPLQGLRRTIVRVKLLDLDVPKAVGP